MYAYKKRYKSKTFRGKLRVCNELAASKRLRHLVPHTVSLTKRNLKRMTGKYKALYVKPNIGSMGIDVCKLECSKKGYELLSTGKRRQIRKRFKILSTVYKHIKAKHKQSMIIQKGITLDKVKGRPYDIRAMVQRKPRGSWTCTGFLVKVGRRNKIVTNYYQGGEIYTIEKLLRTKGLSPSKHRPRIQSLSQTAVRIARRLNNKCSAMHEIGVDFAYDTKQRLWILEVNSNHPQFYPLKKLDRFAYNQMASYARSYGRRDD
ncbi:MULTISPECIES: YheC/YheD family protein [unclassified Paenibacillus]|uniref:YheC/YheD family protein n=1 Tax=unclassified Paenibacillus TaxID=185978 RepID=UPI001AE9EE06|nr:MULTISPECIES: YheC/YheD family protein [unclassified Paenibacillus]MBP1155627.1 glutathione synthase/RimK-type ligase-like ATP-grasp enzyme [Paenibacillus sp. PvP091]MBP1168987.1 glutathione synthase/RimK-type ligase-like ATP-grasp enzyme [Paenibacillus sp. PvR098]MBP2440015.1 glutathione synthase/RimK-type ligase-like ATP-grasp enzyme [Paenibacillus sp. PvP052]